MSPIPSCARPRPWPERGRGPSAALLFVILTAACSSSGSRHASDGGSPDLGYVDPRAAVCADAGVPVPSYAVIQSIFDAECITCHTAGNDLVLTAGASWANLVGRAAPEGCGGILVTPGDPSASYLYQKISRAQPCSGTQMPAGEFGPVPLPDCVVAIIRDWIAAGALGPGGSDGG